MINTYELEGYNVRYSEYKLNKDKSQGKI